MSYKNKYSLLLLNYYINHSRFMIVIKIRKLCSSRNQRLCLKRSKIEPTDKHVRWKTLTKLQSNIRCLNYNSSITHERDNLNRCRRYNCTYYYTILDGKLLQPSNS